jgi:predicted Zn finger-like uncharacterized protein
VKFLCDQCKAKYQISDDKVAGKTVRMKCRKCGHMIEVRASVTETSVAGNTSAAAAAARQSEVPPPPGGGPPRPPPPTAKPATLPTARSPLATSLSQAKPPAPRPTQRPEAGLAGAFKSSMQTTREDEAALLELSSADEWYCAINGVPVGPIRITELRRKAALGAVTDDSLVWQEGMEEWRPVKTIAELASLVRDAASNRGPSLGSPEPPNVRQSVLPPSPGGASASMRPAPMRPTPPRPASDRPAPVATGRSNVVPITSRLATAERLDEAPANALQSPAPAGAQSERFSIAPDPFSAPGAGAAAAAAPYRDAAIAAPAAPPPVIVQKAPPNYMGIGVIAAFIMFGGVAAYAIFIKAPPVQPPAQVIVQQVPMPTSPGTAAPTDSSQPDTAPAGTASQGRVASRGGASTSGAKDAGAAPDLHGLLNGLGSGPNVSGPSGAAASGTSLTADQIEPVVRSHSVGVRRTCWERGGSTVSSANETLTLTIGGNGRVSNASSSGNDPITGTCLEKETRSWQFPPTGATSTVAIPFHFVHQ